MKRKPIKVEIIEEPEGRFIVRTFAEGAVEREPIAKLPRKKRFPPRPYWTWKFEQEDE